MQRKAHTLSERALAVVAVVCLVLGNLAAQQSATDLRGKPFDPVAARNDKPVVLIFVRTDCPISQRYAPTVQEVIAKYAGQVTFWLVFPSNEDSADMIAGYVRDYGYKVSALRDPDHVLVSRAKATITPEAALFDLHGELRYHGRIDNLYVSFGRSRRAATRHDLDDAIAAVIAGKPLTSATAPAVGCYIADLK